MLSGAVLVPSNRCLRRDDTRGLSTGSPDIRRCRSCCSKSSSSTAMSATGTNVSASSATVPPSGVIASAASANRKDSSAELAGDRGAGVGVDSEVLASSTRARASSTCFSVSLADLRASRLGRFGAVGDRLVVGDALPSAAATKLCTGFGEEYSALPSSVTAAAAFAGVRGSCSLTKRAGAYPTAVSHASPSLTTNHHVGPLFNTRSLSPLVRGRAVGAFSGAKSRRA
mmetsp:Transcript_14307/g.36894  ORF Transcript_14307/g.36894 Transcript_14307/m.36894 type:complete len:228 (-) Transcript_14307:1395-2078(-)